MRSFLYAPFLLVLGALLPKSLGLRLFCWSLLIVYGGFFVYGFVVGRLKEEDLLGPSLAFLFGVAVDAVKKHTDKWAG